MQPTLQCGEIILPSELLQVALESVSLSNLDLKCLLLVSSGFNAFVWKKLIKRLNFVPPRGTRCITNNALGSYFNKASSCTYLNLKNCKNVTDTGLVRLPKLKHLQFLDLSDTKISDNSIEHIRSLNELRELLLCRCKVTDKAMPAICGFPKLEKLNLSKTGPTSAGFANLRNLTNLKVLDLTRISSLGPEVFQHLDFLQAVPNSLVEFRGCGISNAQIFTFFRTSAKSGNYHSQNKIGGMYQNGVGVPQNYQRAWKYFELASTQSALGKNNLGWLCQNGLGVPKDLMEAARYYRMSAEEGDGSGQNNLGYMYQKGFGVEQDYVQSVCWYRLSAETSPNGQNNLGYMYQWGYGVQKDLTEAVKWYRLSAKSGDSNGQNNLGYMYQHGYGMDKPDIERAKKYYRKSAAQGNRNAIDNLSTIS